MDAVKQRDELLSDGQKPKTVSDAPPPDDNRRTTSGLFRFSAAQFLLVLIALLLTIPFIVELHDGGIVASALTTLVLISSVMAVSGQRRSLVLTILLVLPTLGAEWVEHYQPGFVPVWVSSVARLTFIVYVIAQMLRFILGAPQVNSDVLCAGIAIYLLVGLLWAGAYWQLAGLAPASFAIRHGSATNQVMDQFDALYFSFVSLTCLGCNDIVPLSRVARMLMMVEATTGVLYLAVMIARLVALYSRKPEKPGAA
ncbi:MAG TPA: potassium channel family protein [Verrucomicrobiae bacterium]|nr:potassium channel family protein [Verrucomicrobiae bacterium]